MAKAADTATAQLGAADKTDQTTDDAFITVDAPEDEHPGHTFMKSMVTFAEKVHGVLLEHPYAMASSTGKALRDSLDDMRGALVRMTPPVQPATDETDPAAIETPAAAAAAGEQA